LVLLKLKLCASIVLALLLLLVPIKSVTIEKFSRSQKLGKHLSKTENFCEQQQQQQSELYLLRHLSDCKKRNFISIVSQSPAHC